MENSNIRTFIPESNMKINSDGVLIPSVDLREKITYIITVVFIDVYDDCKYSVSIDYYGKLTASYIIVFSIGETVAAFSH